MRHVTIFKWHCNSCLLNDLNAKEHRSLLTAIQKLAMYSDLWCCHIYCCLVNFQGQNPVISIGIQTIGNFAGGQKIFPRGVQQKAPWFDFCVS